MKYSYSLYLLWYKSKHDLCLGAISGEALKVYDQDNGSLAYKVLNTVRETIPDILSDIEGEEVFQVSDTEFTISGDNGIITLELIPCKWL